MNRQIFPVSLEILREGPPHNQLLSPVTRYLAHCGDVAAQVVTVPYEHLEFKVRLKPLRYSQGADDSELTRTTIQQTATDMARFLGSIPGFAAAMTNAGGSPDSILHLEMEVIPDELTMLPFELASVPENCPGSPKDYLCLQSVIPVTMTRRLRGTTLQGANWAREPRILFAWSEAGGAVNHEQHLNALWNAFAPVDRPSDLVFELANASLKSIGETIENGDFTHVHILAHGVEREEASGLSSFGLALNKAVPRAIGHECVGGQELASILCPVTKRKESWPLMVSLAACDSSNQGDVQDRNGASIAQDLHRAGIPLVIGSQFPLTMEGSVLIARDFYRSILRGDDPRLSLHVLRGNLRNHPRAQHDWASLVVYASFPDGLRRQFGENEVRYGYARRMNKWAIDNLNSLDFTVDDYSTWSAMKQGALDAIATFPTSGRFAAEGHGMAGSSYKQLARSQFEWATRPGNENDQLEDLNRCINALETASQHYWSAVEVYLGPTDSKPQKIASLHWVLTQYLSLQAILGRPIAPELWMTAKASADLERRMMAAGGRVWAVGSLIELYILQLALPAADRAVRQCRTKALACARELVELAEDPNSFPRFTTRRALGRYEDWSQKAFVDALGARGLKRPRSWKLSGGLLRATQDVLKIL